jgi:predicted nucleic acid-binding protein
MTQNGFVRILSKPAYPRPLALVTALVTLRAQVALASHEFSPDDISVADPAIFHHDRILGPNQLTDIYLLGLAVKNGGRLVTFDRTIPMTAVPGAEPHHLIVL